jgi:nitrogen fixation protein FixH
VDNDPTTNRQLARRNVVLGWSLFGVFVLLFAGTVAVALIYLAVAG